MRFICGFIAFAIWTALIAKLTEAGYTVDYNTFLMTAAIVTAGAMAGGG